jgi:stage II sporulation protein D
MTLASCAPPRATPPPVPTPGAPQAVAPQPAPAPPERGEPTIAVGLAWDLDSLSLDPVAAARVELAGAERGLDVAGRLSVTLRGAQAEARAQGGGDAWRLPLRRGDTLWIAGIEGPADGPARSIRWDGKSWRGSLKVFINPRGTLTLAARLPLETYLLGVVPGEIGALSEELLEAGRAQAIAARSYTLFYRGRRADEGFDLYGTVEDQLYGPIEAERPLATRVVRSTAGEVARSEGRPIRANYYSTCGGITADVWEAWPTPPMAYLVSHRDRDRGADHCAGSPTYRWREEWTPAELLGNLATYGPPLGVALPAGGLGDLLDIRVLQRSRSGRAWRLEVTGTRGSVVLPAYVIRQVMRRGGNGGAILRSNLFKIEVRRDPATRRALAVVASGAGFGHGVGLCQTGALGMARQGVAGEAILLHYYPGVTVDRVY